MIQGIVRLAGKVLGLSAVDDRPPPEEVGRDDWRLPWYACRGVPRDVVVGDDPTVRGSHVGITAFREQLARSCPPHREGWSCGQCRDAAEVAHMVSVHGRVRVTPAA